MRDHLVWKAPEGIEENFKLRHKELLDAARWATTLARARKTFVGAAVLFQRALEDGWWIAIGANVESHTQTLTTHAEIMAVQVALLHRATTIRALGLQVVRDNTWHRYFPCGLCLQYLAEKAGLGLEIHIPGAFTTLDTLLPFPYRAKNAQDPYPIPRIYEIGE